ncbi:serine/threonine-protein kinase [Agromyces humi]|uniref:serine/threonine-protein kinase n=1 Tax=Agromyces humi TaxID=1766800 RepID=UPI00135AA07B|nr:serine/threonine-protein kinase [Agromyces humi]
MTDPILADTPAAPDHSRQRYDFREHLGSGGMADVYRARDTELGRDVAVKVFRATDDTVADLQRREREIRLLSRLNHPGLVDIHDAGTLLHDGQARRYVVMQYIEGRSLAHRLARGPMTPRQVADVGAQIADALSYVHGHSIVHRDVKPENILVADVPTLGYTLMAKLADFGVAQFIDGSRLTSDGAIMGTAAYISPEQARGEEIGTSSDVYSLGLVLLEALRGEREYTGSAIEAALARLHRPPHIPEDLPEQWQSLLAAMTSTDPAVRPTAHDVAASMRDIIRGMIITGRGKHESGRARPSRARSVARVPEGTAARGRGAVVVGAAILGLAAAITVVVGVVAGVVAV